MNLFLIQDIENENYLTDRFNKWSPHMYKAHFFTQVSIANKMRKDLKAKTDKKYVVQEYQLVHITTR